MDLDLSLSAPFVLPSYPTTTLGELVASSDDLEYAVSADYIRLGMRPRYSVSDFLVLGRDHELTGYLARVNRSATTREVYTLMRRAGLRPGNRFTGLMVGVHHPDVLYHNAMALIGGRLVFVPESPVSASGKFLASSWHLIMGYGCDRPGVRCNDCLGDPEFMAVECLFHLRAAHGTHLWDVNDSFLVVRRQP